jgi:hypothetical protein
VDEGGDTKDSPDEIPHDATLPAKGLGGERRDMNTLLLLLLLKRSFWTGRMKGEIPLGMNICFNLFMVVCFLFFLRRGKGRHSLFFVTFVFALRCAS